MTIVFRFVAALLSGVLALPAGVAAEEASRWAEGFHSKARLVSGGAVRDSVWAGVEIALDPGYKTYWREPGDSGLPPRFEWAGSENAGSVEMSWPAPTRVEDAGGVANVYSQRVLFPVRIRPADPTRPVALRLTLEYGVCKEICIPAEATLGLTVETGDAAHRGAIEQAFARVPRPQALGAEGPLAITAVERVAGEKPTYRVTVRSPNGAALFAEPPENWYVSTSGPQAEGDFTLTVDEGPKDGRGPLPLRLTLATAADAIETDVQLDAGPASR